MEAYNTEIEHNGVKINIQFDGFCFAITAPDKFIFAASVNDPTVSERGNASLLLFDPNEIAARLEEGETVGN